MRCVLAALAVVLCSCKFSELPNIPSPQSGTMSLPFEVDGTSRVYQDDFESGQLSSFWTECFFCSDGEGPVEGPSVNGGRYSFRIHYDRDESSAWMLMYPIHFESVYASFWQFFPDGLNGNSIKQFRLANSRGLPGLEGYFNLQAWGKTQQNDAYFGRADIALYFTNPIPKGQWVRTELYVKYNSMGQRDGIYWQKANGITLPKCAAGESAVFQGRRLGLLAACFHGFQQGLAGS